jgi:hypothetical protein
MKVLLYCFFYTLLKGKNKIGLINNDDILINEKYYFINDTTTKYDNFLKFKNLFFKKDILYTLENKKESNVNKLNLINFYNDIIFDKRFNNFYKDLEF